MKGEDYNELYDSPLVHLTASYRLSMRGSTTHRSGPFEDADTIRGTYPKATKATRAHLSLAGVWFPRYT